MLGSNQRPCVEMRYTSRWGSWPIDEFCRSPQYVLFDTLTTRHRRQGVVAMRKIIEQAVVTLDGQISLCRS